MATSRNRNALRITNEIEADTHYLTELRSLRPVKAYELRRIEHVAKTFFATRDTEVTVAQCLATLGPDGHAVVRVIQE